MHLNRCQNHELGWTEGGLRATSSLLTSCRDFSCFRDGVSRFRFFIQTRRRCLFFALAELTSCSWTLQSASRPGHPDIRAFSSMSG